ncbi:glycosyltransferase family 9 protein [bacterium]|nr:glycosyltransferase family 9 protein [bacterium]
MILITPAIRAIRARHPEAHIGIMVGDWSKVALVGNPYLDEIISYPDSWIQNKQPLGCLRLVYRLWKGRFDTAYIFHSHTLIQLMTVLAGIPERYGFFDKNLKKPGKYLKGKAEWQPNIDRFIADNYLDIPRLNGWQGSDTSLDFFLSDAEQSQADKLIESHGLTEDQFFILAPGGGVNPRQNVFAKRWGADKFIELCNLLGVTYHLPIVLTGSKQEIPLGEEIAARANGQIIDLVGKVSFRQAAGLVRRSQMLVSNDSAIMHIAVAFSKMSLTIFGPSNPHSLMPISEINQWITSGVDCSPCYCNSIFEGCEHLRCMTELSAAQVLERIQKMLDFHIK